MLNALVRWAHALATVLLVCIVAINAANVIGRVALNAPISWSDEIMVFCMIGLVFAAAPAVTRQAAHVRMDIALQRLPPGARRAMETMMDMLSVVILAIYVCASVPLVIRLAQFGQVSDAAGVPLAIPQSTVPLGFTLMILVLLVRIARALRGNDRTAG